MTLTMELLEGPNFQLEFALESRLGPVKKLLSFKLIVSTQTQHSTQYTLYIAPKNLDFDKKIISSVFSAAQSLFAQVSTCSLVPVTMGFLLSVSSCPSLAI